MTDVLLILSSALAVLSLTATSVLLGWVCREATERRQCLAELRSTNSVHKEAAEKLAALHNEAAQQHRFLTEKVQAHEFALHSRGSGLK